MLGVVLCAHLQQQRPALAGQRVRAVVHDLDDQVLRVDEGSHDHSGPVISHVDDDGLLPLRLVVLIALHVGFRRRHVRVVCDREIHAWELGQRLEVLVPHSPPRDICVEPFDAERARLGVHAAGLVGLLRRPAEAVLALALHTEPAERVHAEDDDVIVEGARQRV